MGEQGMIGLLGTDGVFRSLRVGDAISSGEKIDYEAAVAATDDSIDPSTKAQAAWDGVRRFTSLRKLYDFPLSVVVGLSEVDQSVSYLMRVRTYLTWATAGSVLLILIGAALWRMSWQIEKGRRNEIADRCRSDQRLRIAAAAFDSQEAMFITDDRRVILQVNRAFTKDMGYAAADLIGGTSGRLKSAKIDVDFYASVWLTAKHQGAWQGEIWVRHQDGTDHPKWLTISALKDANGRVTHYVSSHYDITQRKLAEQRVQELAFFDPLTGLPRAIARSSAKKSVREFGLTSAIQSIHATRSTATKPPILQPV